jgi:hypothetical protein
MFFIQKMIPHIENVVNRYTHIIRKKGSAPTAIVRTLPYLHISISIRFQIHNLLIIAQNQLPAAGKLHRIQRPPRLTVPVRVDADHPDHVRAVITVSLVKRDPPAVLAERNLLLKKELRRPRPDPAVGRPAKLNIIPLKLPQFNHRGTSHCTFIRIVPATSPSS